MYNAFRFALLAAAVSMPAAALAQSNSGSRSVAVSYADLDLGSPAGRQTLDERVAGAVRELCGPSWLLSMNETVQRRHCVREAFASARPQVALAVARRGTGTLVAMTTR